MITKKIYNKQSKKNITSRKKYDNNIVKETRASNILKFTAPIEENNRNTINGSIILKEEYCKNYSNSFDTFEDKFEEFLKTNNINPYSKKYNLQKQTLKDINDALHDNKYTPNNDYYSYINDRWIKTFREDKNKDYIAQFDNFRLIQDKIYNELIELVKNYLQKTKNSKDHFDISFRNYYNSFVLDKKESKVLLNHINNYLIDIDTLINDNKLWKMLAVINEIDSVKRGSPLIWSIKPDPKEPNIFRSFIGGPKLSLYDVSVYFDDGQNIEYKKIYKNTYIKYLKQLFEYSFGDKYYEKFNVNDIFEVEKNIAYAYACDNIQTHDDGTFYNKVSSQESINKYKFNWDEFTKQIGFNKTPSFFITPDLNYLSCITELLLKEWRTPQWRTYWIYLYAREINRFDLANKNPIYFNFFGKFQKGLKSNSFITPKVLIQRMEIFRITMIAYAFNTFLSKLYIERYLDIDLINYVRAMSEDLRTVFIRIIKKNNWLQPSTKKVALKKLEKLKIIIGYPNKFIEESIIDYVDDDFWINLTRISKFSIKRDVLLDGKHVINLPIIDWSEIPVAFRSTQVYNANAFYTQTNNSIYIPLGYIQKPFVDLEERGIEYNLSHVGFTLAHEMSHALDSWGSKYDENGKLQNWWTEADAKHFRKIQEDVVKQYEKFADYDGIVFNAWPSIDENLADISAMNICCEYLRDFQMKNNDILPIVGLSFAVFFVYFAFQQRQKLSDKVIQMQLITNPHPLDKYRCNVPLSRSELFRSMYKVKKGDKMWWHSSNKIW
jgi:putative endopeptidase